MLFLFVLQIFYRKFIKGIQAVKDPSIHSLLLFPDKVVGTFKDVLYFLFMNESRIVSLSLFFLIALIFSRWTQITILKWQECYTWRSVSLLVGLACTETCV